MARLLFIGGPLEVDLVSEDDPEDNSDCEGSREPMGDWFEVILGDE